MQSDIKEDIKRRKREKGEIQSDFAQLIKKVDKGKEMVDKAIN